VAIITFDVVAALCERRNLAVTDRRYRFDSGKALKEMSATLVAPFASITWIRFNGSVPNPFGTLSAFGSACADPGWLPCDNQEVTVK
jgi:hypothetical protein